MLEPSMREIRIDRLTVADTELARALFATMARVFAEDAEVLGDAYLTRLLDRDDFWALAASVDGQLVGGLTAHTLPLTRGRSVRSLHLRHRGSAGLAAARCRPPVDVDIAIGGGGRWYRGRLRPDNDDTHALDFYQALGGAPTPVTVFTFDDSQN
jgi:aminoglycoside 3-N-acetyltransferase I